MTAIFTYLSNNPKVAIMACDNKAVFKNSKEIKAEKINCLFDRFYISTFGPNMLEHAITLISDYQKFQNCLKPSTVDQLYQIIESMYDITLEHYKKSPHISKDPSKLQGGIIYDSKEHVFCKMSFGQPFSENIFELRRSFDPLGEGIHRLAMYDHSKKKYENLDLSALEKDQCRNEVNKEFKELDSEIMSKYPFGIGMVGSYLFVSESDVILESCYKDYGEYCTAIENRFEEEIDSCHED